MQTAMKAEMQAAVYHGPEDIRFEERPMPNIGPDEALLKVVSAGICGTDLRIYKGQHRQYAEGVQRIPGHELVGDIAAIGENVRGLEVGTRVMVAPNMGCGHCKQCITGNNNRCANYQAFGITLDGAFAEYMRIPAAAILQGNLIPVDPTVDPGAISVIEPLACVVRGQDPLHIGPDDVVVVIGAGPIGVLHIMLAKLKGARQIIVTDRNPDRLAFALDNGADLGIDASEQDVLRVIAEETDGDGADVILTCAPSHSAQEEAIQMAAIGGRINFFGGLPKDRPTIQANTNTIHYRELLITGTTACSTSDCRRAAKLATSGQIDLSQIVSERFPLSDVKAAFEAAQNRESLKIVLEP